MNFLDHIEKSVLFIVIIAFIVLHFLFLNIVGAWDGGGGDQRLGQKIRCQVLKSYEWEDMFSKLLISGFQEGNQQLLAIFLGCISLILSLISCHYIKLRHLMSFPPL